MKVVPSSTLALGCLCYINEIPCKIMHIERVKMPGLGILITEVDGYDLFWNWHNESKVLPLMVKVPSTIYEKYFEEPPVHSFVEYAKTRWNMTELATFHALAHYSWDPQKTLAVLNSKEKFKTDGKFVVFPPF